MSKDISIRNKLIFVTLLAVAMLISLAIINYYGQHKSNVAFNHVHDGAVTPLMAVSEIDSSLKEVRFHMAGYTIDIMSSNGARAKLKEVRAQIPQHWKNFMVAFDANQASEEERNAVAGIDKGIADLGPIFDALDAAYGSENKEGITEILNTKWPRIIKTVVRPLSEVLMPARVAYMQKTFEESETDGERLVMISLGGNIAGIIILTIIMVPLMRSLSQAIDDMRGVLTRVAGGDLTVHADTRRGDELGDMARSLETTLQSLRELINGTITSAKSVSGESEAIRKDASNLTHTAEEQSTATSAIAAAVEELTVSIGVMSESANDAGRLSSNSEKQAHDSLAIVSAATDTIRNVADGMTEASVTMQELSNKVANIDSIVQTIRDIADQTNLLALNAAIEAARAGEQGRGFAVVADEVRKLAERTTSSTQEISDIVGGVRHTTNTALGNMSRAKSLAEEGAKHTDGIRSTMMGMDESSIEVRKAVESIATALREQSAASTDIAQRVEMIAQGIERTYSAATESNRRATDLVDLSHALTDKVSRFRT